MPSCAAPGEAAATTTERGLGRRSTEAEAATAATMRAEARPRMAWRRGAAAEGAGYWRNPPGRVRSPGPFQPRVLPSRATRAQPCWVVCHEGEWTMDPEDARSSVRCCSSTLRWLALRSAAPRRAWRPTTPPEPRRQTHHRRTRSSQRFAQPRAWRSAKRRWKRTSPRRFAARWGAGQMRANRGVRRASPYSKRTSAARARAPAEQPPVSPPGSTLRRGARLHPRDRPRRSRCWIGPTQLG